MHFIITWLDIIAIITGLLVAGVAWLWIFGLLLIDLQEYAEQRCWVNPWRRFLYRCRFIPAALYGIATFSALLTIVKIANGD
jgi:hypothetical protein